MKKYWGLLLMFTGLLAKAQVQIQSTIPSVGLVQKNQLWNLVLVNGTGHAIDGRLELLIRDPQSGIELMTAATAGFTLPKGSAQLNVNRLSPIQYNYLGMEPDKTISGLLPAGAYLACYSFVSWQGEKNNLIAEECIRFDVEPLSPPMLMFPADSSVLDIQPAQFTWTPPTPATMFNRLRYEMLVAEIRPGQKPAEALQNNLSFYNTAGIANNLQTYPASLPAFDKEKWYAWQVIARDDKNYAGHSEVWVFKVKEPDHPRIDPIQASFITLGEAGESGNMGVVHGNRLFIKYYSADKEHTAPVRFLTTGNKLMLEVKKEIQYGDNFLSFQLPRAFAPGNTYIVEIIDQRNGSHKALFSINQ